MKNKAINIGGKIIAIIGATGILGTEYVKFLSANGANVIIGDTDFEKCSIFAETIQREFHTDCLPLEINLFDENSIEKFYKEIINHYGKIDVVINNSQVKPDGFYDSFENYSKKTLMKVLEGNTVGIAISCQRACKIFIEQGYGNIINIASIYGIVAADQRLYNDVVNPYNLDEKFSSPVSYAISKAAVVHLTKYLASYYREKNIRVNCLTPGGVFDKHDENFNKNYSERTLLGRMANKNEYNGAILFLASDSSSYMTGANLIVDGGWSVI